MVLFREMTFPIATRLRPEARLILARPIREKGLLKGWVRRILQRPDESPFAHGGRQRRDILPVRDAGSYKMERGGIEGL
jgi:hypothetical protein